MNQEAKKSKKQIKKEKQPALAEDDP